MNLNFNSGTIFNITDMSFVIKREKKSFQINIRAEDGVPVATIHDMDSDTEINVINEREDTLESMLSEINFHLTDVK